MVDVSHFRRLPFQVALYKGLDHCLLVHLRARTLSGLEGWMFTIDPDEQPSPVLLYAVLVLSRWAWVATPTMLRPPWWKLWLWPGWLRDIGYWRRVLQIILECVQSPETLPLGE
jgi:hypothetical protein